jgi:hypothetical protein
MKFFLSAGLGFRVYPPLRLDRALILELDRVFMAHQCLRAWAAFSIKRGIFARRVNAICFVYAGDVLRAAARDEIVECLKSYVNGGGRLVDLIELDHDAPEQRAFIESLMRNVDFAVK